VTLSETIDSARFIVVAGKGGVGKTTCAAAIALAASRRGRPSLIIEVDGKPDLALRFGAEPLGYESSVLRSNDAPVMARRIGADDAMRDYLDSHGLKAVRRQLVRSGALEIIATATPGIKDILVLGKVKQIEQELPAETLIVLDAPAAGHAITFLDSARAMLDTARGGPLRNQASQVLELLSDHHRSQLILVAIPEETPINELIETAFKVEDRLNIRLGPVIINSCLDLPDGLDVISSPRSDADRAANDIATFHLSRFGVQTEQLERLDEELPIEQVRLPHLNVPFIDNNGLDTLALALLGELP
jgi:anion-transporting  ArsA/GET3 family ATPase